MQTAICNVFVLQRSKAAAVGARPGFTRTMQEVKLDNNVVLLDW